MTSAAFEIFTPRLIQAGVDGGHRYISGRCTFRGDDVPVHVFMLDAAEEAQLIASPHSPLVVDCPRHDYVDGVGLSLWDCRILVEP
jgi:hypothetical protein